MRKLPFLLATLAVGLFPAVVMSPALAAGSYYVSAVVSDASIRAGDATTLSGNITPHTVNKMVHIQVYKGGSWVEVTTTRTDGNGHYSKSLTPKGPGTAKYRVKTLAKGSTSGGTSRTVSINVYAWLELVELKTVSDVSAMYADHDGDWRLQLGGSDGEYAMDGAWVNDKPGEGVGYGKTTWNLQNKCTKLRGKAGLDNESTVNAKGHLTISFDGGDYFKVFEGDEPEDLDININKTRYLTIQSDRHDVVETTVTGVDRPEVLCRAYLP